MPRPPSVADDELLELIVPVFRRKGYEGTAIGDLSAASGLQRASLYHRYPGGKEEMAEVVLAAVERRFTHVLAPLREEPDVRRGIARTARRIAEFYEAGALSCVLDTMTLAGAPAGVRDRARALARGWIDAMAAAAERAGHDPAAAARAATEAFVRIEGALVLSRVTGDIAAFTATLAALPDLLAPTA